MLIGRIVLINERRVIRRVEQDAGGGGITEGLIRPGIERVTRKRHRPILDITVVILRPVNAALAGLEPVDEHLIVTLLEDAIDVHSGLRLPDGIERPLGPALGTMRVEIRIPGKAQPGDDGVLERGVGGQITLAVVQVRGRTHDFPEIDRDGSRRDFLDDVDDLVAELLAIGARGDIAEILDEDPALAIVSLDERSERVVPERAVLGRRLLIGIDRRRDIRGDKGRRDRLRQERVVDDIDRADSRGWHLHLRPIEALLRPEDFPLRLGGRSGDDIGLAEDRARDALFPIDDDDPRLRGIDLLRVRAEVELVVQDRIRRRIRISIGRLREIEAIRSHRTGRSNPRWRNLGAQRKGHGEGNERPTHDDGRQLYASAGREGQRSRAQRSRRAAGEDGAGAIGAAGDARRLPAAQDGAVFKLAGGRREGIQW